MRVICVWRDGEDYSRTVQEWLAEFERQTGKTVESMNPDVEEGFCQAYDIVEYPTMIALDDKGSVLAIWRGEMLPTFDEVSFWLK